MAMGLHMRKFCLVFALAVPRCVGLMALNALNETLMLRIESGDENTKSQQFESALLVASGADLFELISSSVAQAAQLSGTAKPLTEKQLPDSIEYFGWCTWDAFYSSVSAQDIQEGLRSLAAGGIRPKTLIIDDGWQMTEVDEVYRDATLSTAKRRLGIPLMECSIDEFEESEQRVLATFASDVPGGSEVSSFMPALADADTADGIKERMRNQEGMGTEKQEKMMQQLEELKQRAGLEVPAIERTIMKLTKEPKDRSLWARLAQRILGYLVGMVDVVFLFIYQKIVDPAGPNAWPVRVFQWFAVGPGRSNMLGFFEASGDFTKRILTVKANGKFSKPDATSDQRQWYAEAEDFRTVTTYLREAYGLEYILCWHALPAYWGGVNPEAPEFQRFEPRLVHPVPTLGLREIEPAMLWNPAVLAGIGIVEDAQGLYKSMHEYLSAAGVDGVKVDCQAGVGLVGSVIGGGAAIARKYHASLEASIEQHFPGNHAINCMCHSTENIYQMRDTAIIRASDDFYPREEASSTPHIAACAYNSLFLGALCQPDWDMFQSLHGAARLHACARAVSGGAVYVSDKVGKHDFDVLKQLVLRDGSILRALRPGLPTADCVFADPLRDGATPLKVWSHNAVGAVVAVFHLQGSCWDRTLRRFVKSATPPAPLAVAVTPADVPGIDAFAAAAPGGHSGEYALLRNSSGAVSVLPDAHAAQEAELQAADADVLTIVPAAVGPDGARFAPLGLRNMLNSGGAVTSWAAVAGGFEVGLRGEGEFSAWCSQMPRVVRVDGDACARGKPGWTFEDGALVVRIPERSGASVAHSLAVLF